MILLRSNFGIAADDDEMNHITLVLLLYITLLELLHQQITHGNGQRLFAGAYCQPVHLQQSTFILLCYIDFITPRILMNIFSFV